MTAFTSTIQKLTPGALVELYILDLSPIGVVGTRAFTNNIMPDGTKVKFGDIEFEPVDFASEGWEYNGTGAFPRPTFQVTNVGGFLSGLLYEYQDLVNAKLTRIRTFEQFLDGGVEADDGMMYPPDVYIIFQKKKHNKTIIEFELAAAADQEGQRVPARKILRDTCMHTYRQMTPSGFDYENVTCPYMGTAYFDEHGDPVTDPYQDKCNFQLTTGCKRRFGNKNLPTYAFPGAVRTRY